MVCRLQCNRRSWHPLHWRLATKLLAVHTCRARLAVVEALPVNKRKAAAAQLLVGYHVTLCMLCGAVSPTKDVSTNSAVLYGTSGGRWLAHMSRVSDGIAPFACIVMVGSVKLNCVDIPAILPHKQATNSPGEVLLLCVCPYQI